MTSSSADKGVIKWAEISSAPNVERGKTLSDFLNSNGVKNTYQAVECMPRDFRSILDKSCQEFDVLRIGSPFLDEVPKYFDHLPLNIQTLGAGDTLVKTNGKWWIRTSLYTAIIRVSKYFEGVDLANPALIVGSGGSARIVIGALIRMGFGKFNITEQFDERGEVLVRDLRKRYFNIDFKFTPHSGITMLPGIHSCMINTTPHVPSNEILKDLYYFNFLKRPGLVVDLNLRPAVTPLLKEAQNIGASFVSGVKLAAQTDLEFAGFFSTIDLDVDQYEDLLTKAFAE